MPVRTNAMVALILAAASAAAQAPEVPARDALVFRHVAVVDVERGRVVRDRDVIVRDGRIVSVRAAAPTTASAPRDARLIDGRGKFLMPGLWDMHVHLDAGGIGTNVFFPLMLANGITGVRDMSTDCVAGDGCRGAMTVDTVRTWRREIADGVRAGPRVVASSQMFDGPSPIWPHGLAVRTPAEGRAAVATFAARGVDLLKIYSLLPRDAFFAVARAARARQLPFGGHVPVEVSTLDATTAGMTTMEHGFGLPEGCSRDEARLRAEQRRSIGRWVEPVYVEQFARALATYDARRCAALMAAFRRNNTAQTPTLVMLRNWALQDDPRRADPARHRYMPQLLLDAWDRPSGAPSPEVPNPTSARIDRLQWMQQRVREMQRVGVTILAGTDVGNAYIYPGFALHDELRLLVQAGLTPAEALRAATINPARVLRMADSLGAVAPGRRADLVLLDADPLADITNAARIDAVLADGRLYDRALLDRMLARVESIARR